MWCGCSIDHHWPVHFDVCPAFKSGVPCLTSLRLAEINWNFDFSNDYGLLNSCLNHQLNALGEVDVSSQK